MANTLIVVLGPTGVGKSDTAVKLACHFGSEIISADSRQFYREMTIGTAVPPDSCLSLVKHHFIKFLSLKDYYSSSLFERDVLRLLPTLFEKNSRVIMAGGSGMYIDAVINGIDDIPDTDPAIRYKFNRLYREEGLESLRVLLKLYDPDYYSKVDLKNHKRIIRALEICETTGRPYSAFLTKRKAERDFDILRIGLIRERELLYEMINQRVDNMISQGLEEEARNLFNMKNHNALKCVGYSEFFGFFEGRITRDEAVRLIKRNSRRYAKRQITWWAKDKDIKWFDPESIPEIIRYVEENT
ncbi:MAG TPA: tRNA (adenosine(37)-N6)-dimethylallyltransferase MiaA [Bacteroidales bacterium]|nr:tRNA (adenosine(37)-N6)-dimethylallyltransferase MiaA [Bacteroidales bacterium]HNR42260.1 tRNA (adenosine(37)-N6)-dimethylallyltransferase MiaA [Bacteroidales bacterium]